MTIQLEEWTFGKNLDIALRDDNQYPDDASESRPTCRFNRAGSTKQWVFPTGATIGGKGVEGFNEGIMTLWTYMYSVSAQFYFAFRRTTALNDDMSFASANLTGYVLSVDATRYKLQRMNAGAVDATLASVNFPSGYSPRGIWTQHRLKWYVETGVLKMSYENRNTSSNAFRQVGDTASDSTNSYVSSTNKMGFYFNNYFNYSYMEGIRLSPNV